MRKYAKIIILAVVIIFGFCLLRDFCIKSIIGTVLTRASGAPTRVGRLSLSIIGQSVKISNLRIYNPQGFERDILADIPKIHIRYDLWAMATGKIHFKELDLEIKEIGMSRNKEGKLNVDALKVSSGKAKDEEAKKAPSSLKPIQIDLLGLAMGRVVNKDYSAGSQPVIKVYDVNLDKTYKNITSVQQLITLIVSEPLKAAGIQGAKIYGVSALAGAAAFPVAAAFIFGGKDHAEEVFKVSIDKAYAAGLGAVKKAGVVKKEEKDNGRITGEVAGAQVVLEFNKSAGGSTQVIISARKSAIPQPEIAAGLMYRLQEELK